jgi:transposase
MKKEKRGIVGSRITTVNPNSAGLDVGSTFHVVAVPPDRDNEPVRTFQSFTADLHSLAEWLGSLGITSVAMESTGIYWVPVYEILERRGFEVLLVNARDSKNVPGRKTDVNDAQWLQQLHEHGLLRGSFRPRDELVRLRAYVRHRERLLEQAASYIQRMQKALMQMNVQLHHAVTDITGVTGLRIIRDIVSGQHDPSVLAQHRDARCKASLSKIQAALTGNYREEHLLALRHSLELYDYHHVKVRECDAAIEQALVELNQTRPIPTEPSPKAGRAKKTNCRPSR